MKKSKFSDSQIMAILKQAEARRARPMVSVKPATITVPGSVPITASLLIGCFG